MLPQGLDFTSEQLERIENRLHRLRWDAEAQCVLLADISGQLISVKGKAEMNTAVLSALAAGNLAATKEMARLVGEPARFKLLLHEGYRRSVYLSDVGEEMALITVFSNHTPIGLVRLVTQQAVKELAQIAAEARANPPTAGPDLTAGLGNSLADELNVSWDSLFKS